VTYTPPEIPEEAKKIAKKFFQHATTVADTRNYDYAIELFIQGLAKDPQNVEQGHKALREVAIKRKLTGGKKVGFFEALKKSTSNKKDPLQAALNAEYLLAKDPFNIVYIDPLVKNLDLAEYPQALAWALGAYLEMARQEKKLSPTRLETIQLQYEKLGDYYEKLDKPDLAIECFQAGMSALEAGINADIGQDQDFMGKQRDLAGRLTILRGKYEHAGDFRQSIKNSDEQKDIRDKKRAVKGEDLLEEMIGKAKADLDQNPDVAGKINHLVDLLLQRGRAQDETESITLLEAAFERNKQYAYRVRSDDIQIRQLTRNLKDLKDKYDAAPAPQLKAQFEQTQKELEETEIRIFQERIKEYPTDLKTKFEYGRKLQKAKKYDEAIPIFQEVLSDPRNTLRAKYYIGVCFFQKGWHQQAIDILNEAIAAHQVPGDPLSKDMHYILGRAYETVGQNEPALKIFNKLVQWDFNFRDVRVHIDKLQKEA
jgi:tetratricopeptide (TPR) repeat protein